MNNRHNKKMRKHENKVCFEPKINLNKNKPFLNKEE